MTNIQPPPEPRQNLLFGDYESTHWIHSDLNDSARLRLEEGWHGVFRNSVLKCLPADYIAQNFSPDQGRPTKEIYSMVGLLLIMEFKQWTALEASEAYSLDSGVQFALNLPRNKQYVSPRTVEYYKRLLREGDDQCAEIFGTVTKQLVDELQLNIDKQRLDSTHVFSNMAKLGRTQLMATAIKRFLTQVSRHNKEAYAALPAELLARYAPAESRIFGFGRPSDEEYAKRIQQLAEDLHYLTEQFAADPTINTRTSYQALARIFQDHCEVKGPKGRKAKVTLKEKATDADGQSSNVMQNTSDPEAGYSGHKGEGYQVQLAQSYDAANDVNLITGCLPQSAAESDSASLIPVLESQTDHGLAPKQVLADTAYGSDANVTACAEAEIKLISPTAGKPAEPKAKAQAAGSPVQASEDPPPSVEKPPSKAARLESRRKEEQTEEWKKEYAKRSGLEGVHRAVDRITGFKDLVVRGKESVSMAIYLKVTGWNILQAGRSYARKARSARKAARQGQQMSAQAA